MTDRDSTAATLARLRREALDEMNLDEWVFDSLGNRALTLFVGYALNHAEQIATEHAALEAEVARLQAESDEWRAALRALIQPFAEHVLAMDEVHVIPDHLPAPGPTLTYGFYRRLVPLLGGRL